MTEHNNQASGPAASGDLQERILLAATNACGYTSWAEAESVNEGDDAGGLRAIADGVLAVVQPELERLTKLAEANGQQAKFWADHFAEIERANRAALGAHHKPGHTVAELITAVVGELADVRASYWEVKETLESLKSERGVDL